MENISCQTLGVSFKMNVCFMAVCCVQWKLLQDIPSTGMEKVDSDAFLGSWVLMASQPKQKKDRTRKAADVYVEANATHVACGWSVLTEIHH